jgi:hypothetical protein
MSAIRQAKLTNVQQSTLLRGAKALKLKTTNSTIEVGGYTFNVTREGAIRGDYDFIHSVAGIKLPEAVANKPRALVGILAQSGTVEVVSDQLTNQGWAVEKNITNGALVATKGTLRIDLNIDRNGIIRQEGTNFEGTACQNTLDMLLSEVGSATITSNEMKTQPAVVVRRAI